MRNKIFTISALSIVLIAIYWSWQANDKTSDNEELISYKRSDRSQRPDSSSVKRSSSRAKNTDNRRRQADGLTLPSKNNGGISNETLAEDIVVIDPETQELVVTDAVTNEVILRTNLTDEIFSENVDSENHLKIIDEIPN